MWAGQLAHREIEIIFWEGNSWSTLNVGLSRSPQFLISSPASLWGLQISQLSLHRCLNSGAHYFLVVVGIYLGNCGSRNQDRQKYWNFTNYRKKNWRGHPYAEISGPRKGLHRSWRSSCEIWLVNLINCKWKK